MDYLITADASATSPSDFLRAVNGKPPMSAAEKSERQARAARVGLLAEIEREEFAVAHREREAMLRDGMRVDECYHGFIARTNAPFTAARERVAARMTEGNRDHVE